MSGYTTNDIINVLWMCGVRTQGGLLMYLRNAGRQISNRTIRSKIKELEENDEVSDQRKEHSGRKRALTTRDETRITTLLNRRPELDAAEIKRQLGLTCSTNVIREYLHKIGFKFLRVVPVPRITLKYKEKRLAFARRYRNDDWDHTFFLDESTFLVGSFKTRTYQKKGARVIVPMDKHPAKLNIIGMISVRGATRLITFEDNLTAISFKRYLNTLKRDADQMYRRGDYRIAMDKDPKHTSGTATDYMEDVGLEWIADWPASSPDLNPIENVWGLMEKEIKKLYIKNLISLKRRIHGVWRRLTTRQRLSSLANSMDDRLKAVVANKGSNTAY